MAGAMRKFLIYLLTVLALGCSSSAREDVDRSGPPYRYVEIYMVRSSVTRAEFEHFKIVSSRLFFECGTISGGKPVADENRILPLALEQYQSIESSLASVEDYYREYNPRGAKEGSASDFADPGVFELTMENAAGKIAFRSSFDSIVNEDGTFENDLNELVHQIRKLVGSAGCNNETFFGMR